MTSRGYDKQFAEAMFEQIKGFSEYGFPESQAASFALLVYASCWIKCHHPAEYRAAMRVPEVRPLQAYTSFGKDWGSGVGGPSRGEISARCPAHCPGRGRLERLSR